MKRLAILIAAVCVLLAVASGIHATESLVTVNYQWYLNNYDSVQETIQKGDEREVVPIINTIGAIWRDRDGAIFIEVAPAIAQALLYVPKWMLLWFQANQTQFDAWIETLPYALLTDYVGQTDSVAKLKQLRQRLISALSGYSGTEIDRNLKAMADRLIERLQTTEVRAID
jgi:predicted PurR-regulated permease PerM